MKDWTMKDWIEQWVCDAPPIGSTFVVVKDEWVDRDGHLVRLIHEVDLRSAWARTN